jgi:hypothetical protein
MIQLRALQPLVSAPARVHEPRVARDWLYKHDHPRHIDRHIDFFGDRTARADANDCGEVFLESLA